MGNIFSGNSRRHGVDYNDLQARIHKLEELADLNKDGLVTKEELQKYTAQELEMKDSEILMLRAEKERLEKDLIDQRALTLLKLKKARKETTTWKKAYNSLYKRQQNYQQLQTNDVPATGEISNQAIERFVNELLEDPNINIDLIPDAIERPLYANTLKVILSIVQKMFNNTNLDLIGHEVKIHMQPNLETRLQDQNE